MVTTPNKGMEQQPYNNPNWNVPNNSNFDIIDAALGGNAAINVTTVGTSPVSLSQASYKNMALSFSGVLSNNVNYQLPSGIQGQWVIRNSTTGAYTLTISSAGGGTSISVPQGNVRSIYCDGVNVLYADSQTTTAGSNGQVIFNNNGPLAGDSDFTFDGFTATVGRIVETSAAIWLSAGTATAYTLTPSPAITSYAIGQRYMVNVHIVNGMNPTISISGLSAKPLKVKTLGVLTSPPAGSLVAGRTIEIVYDGANFVVLNGVWGVWPDSNSTSAFVSPAFLEAAINNRFLASIGSTGYIGTRLTTNGPVVYFQWGRYSLGSAAGIGQRVTFPVSFLSGVSCAWCGVDNAATQMIGVFSIDNFGMSVVKGNGDTGVRSGWWFAMGV